MQQHQLLPWALLLVLLQPSGALNLTCTGGDLPQVRPGTDQLTLIAVSAPVSCRLSVKASTGRWYLKLERSGGADGDLSVRDGIGSFDWTGADQLASDSLARVFTRSSEFSVDLTLKAGQLTLQASLVAPNACPPGNDGWSMPWPGGCLMVSAATTNSLNFPGAQRACERVGANLFTTAGSDPTAWELAYLFYGNRLRPGFGYWIGGRQIATGDWVYINGSKLKTGGTLPPYKYDCGSSAVACQCALYREAQIYRSDCADLRPFICSAPIGGAPSFFSPQGTACVDCKELDDASTASTSDSEESERRMYFYVLGICAFILAAISASVIACFAHSVRRWRLDAKLAATRPPSYETGARSLAIQMSPLPEANDSAQDPHPPLYENYPAEIFLSANELSPSGMRGNSPANQQSPADERENAPAYQPLTPRRDDDSLPNYTCNTVAA